MNVDYITHMGDDLLVVNAARVSFHKESCWEGEEILNPNKELKAADKKLLGYLATNGHWTPFSHPQITLRVRAPVPIRTQFFKHKVGFTENEVSRRYVDDDPIYFTPTKWRKRPTNGAKQGSSDEEFTFDEALELDYTYANALVHADMAYHKMIEIGVAPEQARFVLPQAMVTEWFWTGSLAAYARFAKLRLDPHAQKEITDLAIEVSNIIAPLFPESWKVLTE